jgi:hypothetical protein
VTSDGQQAVSASADHTLKVWDLGSGRELCTLSGHWYSVRAAAVTPDGQRAVSGSDDCPPKVWDLGSGTDLRIRSSHTGIVTVVVVTPDGQRAVSASEDQTLKVWDLRSGRELRTLSGSRRRFSAASREGVHREQKEKAYRERPRRGGHCFGAYAIVPYPTERNPSAELVCLRRFRPVGVECPPSSPSEDPGRVLHRSGIKLR